MRAYLRINMLLTITWLIIIGYIAMYSLNITNIPYAFTFYMQNNPHSFLKLMFGILFLLSFAAMTTSLLLRNSLCRDFLIAAISFLVIYNLSAVHLSFSYIDLLRHLLFALLGCFAVLLFTQPLSISLYNKRIEDNPFIKTKLPNIACLPYLRLLILLLWILQVAEFALAPLFIHNIPAELLAVPATNLPNHTLFWFLATAYFATLIYATVALWRNRVYGQYLLFAAIIFYLSFDLPGYNVESNISAIIGSLQIFMMSMVLVMHYKMAQNKKLIITKKTSDDFNNPFSGEAVYR